MSEMPPDEAMAAAMASITDVMPGDMQIPDARAWLERQRKAIKRVVLAELQAVDAPLGPHPIVRIRSRIAELEADL